MSIESQVFLTGGNWKNFEEMEETISLPELNALAKSIWDSKENDRVFQAALQGIDLYENRYTPDDEDDEEAYRNDIAQMGPYKAQLQGFGVGMGLGYEVEGE